ncbi:MAG: hypothetical protein IH591_17560, partial [Bacteroidales bacterium]|nr:hypothetical protein [Bacteroidales bacterium]
MMRIHSVILSLLLLMIVCVQPASAQKYNFRHFSSPALPDPVVYAVNQDNNGYIWVGTGTGLYRFDGFTFRKVDYPDKESIRFATVIMRDSRGTMWIGGSDGTMHFYNGISLKAIDGIDAQRINDIEEDSSGNIFAVTQNNGIYVISGKDKYIERHIKPTPGLLLYSLCFAGNDSILAGTNENLLLVSAEADSLDAGRIIPGIEYTKVSGIVPGKVSGLFYAGTEDYGIYIVSTAEGTYSAEPVSESEEMLYLRVQSLYTDSEENLWVSTFGSGVIKFYFDETGRKIFNQRNYDEMTGLAGNDARSVFNDVEGNIWIALYGQGLNQLVSEAFTFYQPGNSRDDNNVLYINKTGSEVFLGTPSGYHLFDLFTGMSKHFEPIQRATSGVPASSYLTDRRGTIFIGTAGAGLFSKNG